MAYEPTGTIGTVGFVGHYVQYVPTPTAGMVHKLMDEQVSLKGNVLVYHLPSHCTR